MTKKYIATEDLFIGSAKAHRVGDEVPEDKVEQWGWWDKVVNRNTKAATKAKASPPEADMVGGEYKAEDVDKRK